MSRWEPVSRRSTRPGLGVVSTSAMRAFRAGGGYCAADGCGGSPHAPYLPRRMRPISSVSSRTEWRRLLAHSWAGCPQRRHLRPERPKSSLDTLEPSGRITSRSYRAAHSAPVLDGHRGGLDRLRRPVHGEKCLPPRLLPDHFPVDDVESQAGEGSLHLL